MIQFPGAFAILDSGFAGKQTMRFDHDKPETKDERPQVTRNGSWPRAARVLFVERNTDGTVGGSHRVLLEVVRHLDRNRFDPLVVFYQRHALVHEFEKSARVLFLPDQGLRLSEHFPQSFKLLSRIRALELLSLFLQRTINLLFFAAPQFLRMSCILMRERIDLVCINNSPFQTDWLIACKMLRRKCVSYFRGTPPKIPREHASRFDQYDAIISISNAVTENARRQNAPIDNFHLVYDGIDTDSVIASVQKAPEVTRREFLPAADWSLIGVINNLKHWKGQHIAVEAMRHLVERRNNVVCLLVGDVGYSDTAYAEALRNRISELGLEKNVKLTGRRDDVPDLMIAFDLVLHTSLPGEGFPRVILETMTLGRPIVATAVGPSVEMIEDGVTGLLVHAEDPVALAERIDFALSDHELRSRLGRNAQTRAIEIFGIDANIRATEQVFESVLGRQ